MDIKGFWQQVTIKNLLVNIVISLIYILSGQLGLAFASLHPNVTILWPPSGIALAVLLMFGYKTAPAIFLGAFIVNSITSGTLLTSFGIATGNTIEAVVGAYLVTRFANGTRVFDRASDIFKYTFFASLLSTMISATIGVTTLILGNLASWNTFWNIWITWWLGNMGGSIIIAPLIIIWITTPTIYNDLKKNIHFIISFLILCLVTIVIFYGLFTYIYPYLCIPVAIWITYWFGRKGATLSTVIVTIIAIFYTLQGHGPFARELSIHQSFIFLQIFLNIFSLTTLIYGAILLEKSAGEKALALHEERFKALIEKSFDAIILIDPTSKITYASPSVKRLLGYEPEEIIGMTGFDLVFPEDRPMTMKELAKLVLIPGSVKTVKYRTIKKDKTIIWVETTGTNLLLEPHVNAVVINFRDITDTKIFEERIQREKMQDEAMLTSIGEGIIATDNQGKITMVNQATCNILGWKEDELLGKSVIDTIPMQTDTGKTVSSPDRPLTRVLSHGVKVVSSPTNYYVKKDKTTVPVRFTVTPIIIDDRIAGSIEIFYDMTQQKALDKAKTDFVYLASHELRTPMTAIKGFISMILTGRYGFISEKLVSPLQQVSTSIDRLINLVNDMLNLSRIESNKLHFELTTFNICQCVENVISTLKPIAMQKNITLDMSNCTKQHVLADIQKTQQILNNVIGNALKYTDSGKVSVTINNSKDYIHINIEDTGIGIASEDQKKLFAKFQQITSIERGKPVGTGLGLYISRELARRMDGNLILKHSYPGKGSVFEITLPLADSDIAKKLQIQLSDDKDQNGQN